MGSHSSMFYTCRRDPSLQQQLQGGGARSIVSLNTVLEVYRAHDMGLVRVLPSADDEINTALFHPFMVSNHTVYLTCRNISNSFALTTAFCARTAGEAFAHTCGQQKS